ncbi:ABC-type uncharacterized transport system auxiliary subunit [Duganella sp. 3397]|uniref:hypothetical protein n=1 Tax=Duganella sp. 3397 TaxID=2817732 RepID=UPI00285BCC38|nr:hypothetical protein [Duganella sp. 3397]MDR7050819.1 ABC-type uncharacterized transport system auxiliary subunit [Duganella sp. 3397]
MKPQTARQIISKIIPLVAAALLAGCGTAPPPTQTVYVPVHTPCVKDKPPAPVYEFDKLPIDALAGAKVLALARDWLAGRKYEGALEAALIGCQ